MKALSKVKPSGVDLGFVTAAFALLLAVMLGFAALTFDIGKALNQQRQLQIAADAGALAASTRLGSTATMNSIAQEACSVVAANNLAISNVLSVECGQWASNNFTPACSTACGVNSLCTGCGNTTTNAVRVRVNKQVSSVFGSVLGVSSLNPGSHSVVKATFSGGQGCMKPFGVESATLGNPNIPVGQNFTVGHNAPGNWGKLNINGINMSSGNHFRDYMLSGICGANVAVNQQQPIGPGFGGNLSTGLNQVLNQQFVIARTSPFPNGSGSVTILEFLMVTYLGDNGQNGNNWVGTFRLDARNVTPPTNGIGATVSGRKLTS